MHVCRSVEVEGEYEVRGDGGVEKDVRYTTRSEGVRIYGSVTIWNKEAKMLPWRYGTAGWGGAGQKRSKLLTTVCVIIQLQNVYQPKSKQVHPVAWYLQASAV